MSSDVSRARAAYAFGQLQNVSRKEEVAQRLKGLPIQIRTQGLSTALALLIADADRADTRRVRDLLVGWFMSSRSRCRTTGLRQQLHGIEDKGKAALEMLRWCVETADNAAYRAVQAEALAFLQQAKILAEALAAADNPKGA